MFDKMNRVSETNASKLPVFEKETHGKHPLWTVDETATFLRKSHRTIRDLVYKRRIPYRKVGKSLRFDPEEIERWTLPTQE